MCVFILAFVGAVQHKMPDMASISFRVRIGFVTVSGVTVIVERQRHPSVVGAMVGRAVNG